jgi:pimeloyl-ACP methyl ester carboxylesterase
VALTRDARRREQAVWSLTSRRPEADREATVAAWSAIHQDRPVATINGLRQLWAAARYRAPAHAPEVPMLMLCGAGDRLVNPDCSAAIARAWHATLRTHPWAGHDLPLDDPAWVADTALTWCDQQLSDSRP